MSLPLGQVDSCRYWLIGRLTVNRCVISYFHSPVLFYAVLAFHCVNRYDLLDVIYKFCSLLFVRVDSIFMAHQSNYSDAMFLQNARDTANN